MLVDGAGKSELSFKVLSCHLPSYDRRLHSGETTGIVNFFVMTLPCQGVIGESSLRLDSSQDNRL